MAPSDRLNFVESGGCRIAYREDGDVTKPAVLFSHSLGLDHQSWDAEAERLADRYRVVRIDTRGHGQSDVPTGPYSLEQLGADVLAVADQLGVERFHFVGLSLGGLTALWLGVHQPGRLLSAAYCNTAARLGTEELWNARIAALADGMTAIAEPVFPRFFAPGFEDTNRPLVDRIRQTFLSTDPIGYAGCCAALRDADMRPFVANIEIPSLVVGGTKDLATPAAEARWLHEQIPESRLVLIEEAAHISNLEQPEAFMDAVEKHLSEVRHA